MNIGELARISGVSVRTLRHYDSIGLLKPSSVTEAGYRLYDDEAPGRLSFILLFRELGCPLGEIRRMLLSPGFDLVATLDEEIAKLEKKRQHIENLILLARGAKIKGVAHLRFSVADFSMLDEAVARVADTWQDTPAMCELQAKDARRTEEEREAAEQGFTDLFVSFGQHPDDPASPEAHAMVQRLRDYITEHAYNCELPILRGLADIYDGGGEITQTIDRLAGIGTAAWLAQAVRAYCGAP